MVVSVMGCENKKSTFLETQISQNDLSITIKKFKSILAKKGLTIFNTIDHKANANGVKMDLKPATVIVFGKPKLGTLLIQCNASIGLDLPLRVLIGTDDKGITSFTHTNPEYWILKHNIKDKKCLKIVNKVKLALRRLMKKASEK
jgi:uncharacterized protein (DUF302 family)